MQNVKLKIKIKSLAEESRIIRAEERKTLGRARACAKIQGLEETSAKARDLFNSLQHHRRVLVRQESRHSGLAYALLRGRTYQQVEAGCYKENAPNWDRVTTLVSSFSGVGKTEAAALVKAWSGVGNWRRGLAVWQRIVNPWGGSPGRFDSSRPHQKKRLATSGSQAEHESLM